MAKKPEPKSPLMEEVLALQGTIGVPQWMAKLTPEQLAQLEEIKEAVKNGTVTLPLARIRQLVMQRWSVTPGSTAFRDWMRA